MIQGVTYILNNDATFQSNAGRNKANSKYKAYPVICPQPEEPPYSVVSLSGKSPFGECKGANETFAYSFDVASFHKNFEQVVLLDMAVLDALVGKYGLFNGVTFQEIRFETTRDGSFSDEWKVFSRISSFTAICNENTAT